MAGGGGDEAHGEQRPTFIEQARRRQIVQAAIEVIAEDGYRAATFARIAERAGISPSLISYHFASKSTLLQQVIADITADLEAAINAEVADAPSYRAALRAVIESQARYFAEHTTAVLALGRIIHGGDAVIADRLAEQRIRDLQGLEDLFREGQAEGEFAPFPTRPMAVTLLAALEAVPGELFANPEADPAAHGTALADLFDAGVSRRRRSLTARRRSSGRSPGSSAGR